MRGERCKHVRRQSLDEIDVFVCGENSPNLKKKNKKMWVSSLTSVRLWIGIRHLLHQKMHSWDLSCLRPLDTSRYLNILV